eukprot:3223091-Amphidinium_carterae.1
MRPRPVPSRLLKGRMGVRGSVICICALHSDSSESSSEAVCSLAPLEVAAPIASTSAGETVASIPFAWGLGPGSLCIHGANLKVYVIWRCGEHPLGAYHWAGVHVGLDCWGDLCSSEVFVDGGYKVQRDHCQRVRECAPSCDWDLGEDSSGCSSKPSGHLLQHRRGRDRKLCDGGVDSRRRSVGSSPDVGSTCTCAAASRRSCRKSAEFHGVLGRLGAAFGWACGHSKSKGYRQVPERQQCYISSKGAHACTSFRCSQWHVRVHQCAVYRRTHHFAFSPAAPAVVPAAAPASLCPPGLQPLQLQQGSMLAPGRFRAPGTPLPLPGAGVAQPQHLVSTLDMPSMLGGSTGVQEPEKHGRDRQADLALRAA